MCDFTIVCPLFVFAEETVFRVRILTLVGMLLQENNQRQGDVAWPDVKQIIFDIYKYDYI